MVRVKGAAERRKGRMLCDLRDVRMEIARSKLHVVGYHMHARVYLPWEVLAGDNVGNVARRRGVAAAVHT